MNPEDEERQLRAVAIQNATVILAAREHAEQALVRANEALERKTGELARSLALTRATLESTTDGILVTDEAGRVTDWNEKFRAMWRIASTVLEARDHTALVRALAGQSGDPAAFSGRLDEIAAAVTPESFDTLELADGRVFDRFSTLQVVDGRNAGRVWCFRDITQRRREEEERKALLESERSARSEAERTSALKDEFFTNVSHELRTPLSAILGWSQVLRRRALDDPEAHRGLEAIERNARAQAQLIDDLLDMSRITAGKVRLDVQPLEPVTVIEAAVETVRPAAEGKGIRLEKLLDPSAGPVSGDPNRLQQVVWNLLSNAVKFTPRNGRVRIDLERVNSHVEISVADTGIGIRPEFVPHVFERFRQADASSTRRYGGLGLGLAIVKHLVELHGGTVHVTSPGEGRGATFSVHLPLTAVQGRAQRGERVRPGAPVAAPFGFKASDLSGVKVVVVDDDADARELIRRVLEDCDAEVLCAATAAEALQRIQTERPDVLVSDIGMPEMDGYQLLRAVRALERDRGGRLPAIALTAFARTEDRTRALRAGFLVHLSKPIEPSELVAIVASVAGRTTDL
ncbi:MAG TPA: ATP-binding protein [Burkholderiales bacterium]|nr:ATP-binding protein [Burkholderiales bacterium]